MQMYMSAEILSPGMQDGGHTQLFSVQVFFVGGKDFQGVPCGFKQTPVDHIVMTLHCCAHHAVWWYYAGIVIPHAAMGYGSENRVLSN